MATLNQVNFIGRLGKDPEFSVTPNGTAVAKCSLAVDKSYRKDKNGDPLKQPPTWLNVIVWEKLAEIMEQHACQGMEVFVSGRLDVRDYTDKFGTKRQAIDVTATTVQMLEKKADVQARRAQRASTPYTNGAAPASTAPANLPDDYDPFLEENDLP